MSVTSTVSLQYRKYLHYLTNNWDYGLKVPTHWGPKMQIFGRTHAVHIHIEVSI